ncbi:MAG: hypothetical protein IJR70_03625 [Eubacterium sp.]|nr:hypothetical protein [Eubacterium sp.]
MKKVTLDEVISYFDEQCPNQYSRENKIAWISELDEIIFENIIKNRENPEISTFTPYDSETEGTQELLVPFMFREIYRYFIEKSVAYTNRETIAYNNALQMFEAYYDNYFSWYNRNHKSSDVISFNI